jgi:uncharacterized protein with NRDE domain
MCLILFAHQYHPDFRLVLAANRDEYFLRETASIAFWQDAPHVLAGRDLEKGGTWLGVTRNGRFAAVTNFRDAGNPRRNRLSRGHLVSEYLRGSSSPLLYLNELRITADRYDGFNLLLSDTESLFYFSNRENIIKALEPGVYGLSNHLLDTPWPKVARGKEKLEAHLNGNAINPHSLLDLLNDRHRPDDEELPDTGVSLDWERVLSPIFISSKDYGTRSSTVLLIGNGTGISMTEKGYLDGHGRTTCSQVHISETV